MTLEEAKAIVNKQLAIEREQMRMAEQGRKLEESWKSYVLETERKQEQLKREQERRERAFLREQERQAKELAKHEAWLRKHDEEIEKLKFKVCQAESDIKHLKEHVGELYGLLDAVQVELDQAIIGGKTQIKLQKQAITLRNQIHAAESKLARAQFEKEQAAKKISAA